MANIMGEGNGDGNIMEEVNGDGKHQYLGISLNDVPDSSVGYCTGARKPGL